jgi:nitrite reductase/ring-hydroxylating ferredoxin subunit
MMIPLYERRRVLSPDLHDGCWLRACSVEDVAPGEAIALPVTPPLAVFNVDGEFYATDDTCTHEDSSLADGYIDSDVVECAFHFARFSIRDGRALALPATEPLQSYETHVADGMVYVKVGHAQ